MIDVGTNKNGQLSDAEIMSLRTAIQTNLIITFYNICIDLTYLLKLFNF